MFEQLRDRYLKAMEYFQTQYETDSPDNQQKAIKAFEELETKLNAAFEEIKHKAVEVTEDLAEVEKFQNELYIPKAVDCYRQSKRIVVRMELPEYAKHGRVIDE